jgi:ElaB/YqjD/DUF883 family membrane-anchored ribosome-binding protein
MAEIQPVAKGNRNEQQKFMYRGIDDIMNEIQPILTKNKIFIVPEVLEHGREERDTKNGGHLIYSVLKIKYSFVAEDGSSVSAVVIGEGMDSGDKASNKALAVGLKYALLQTFCIPTADAKDPDHDTPPPSTPAQPQRQNPPPQKPQNINAEKAKLIERLDELVHRSGLVAQSEMQGLDARIIALINRTDNGAFMELKDIEAELIQRERQFKIQNTLQDGNI